MTEQALIVPDQFAVALAQATSIPEVKDLHDYAEGARRWAKARGMGIDAENMATAAVLRTERKIGEILIRMAEDGERATPGEFLSKASRDEEGRAQSSGRMTTGFTLEDLGIKRNESANWQKAAKIPEDTFESMIALAIESGTRLAKTNVYRTYVSPAQKEDRRKPAEDEGFDLFRQGAYLLLGWKTDNTGAGAPTKNGLLTLPTDELAQIATLVQHIVNAYKEARAAR